MAVEDLVRAVTGAIAKLPTAQLEQVSQALQEAHGTLARVTEGTFDPDAKQAVAVLGSGVEGAGLVHQAVEGARQALQRYLGKLGSVEAPAAPPSWREPAAVSDEPTKPRALTPAKLAQLRAELPPPVPRPNPESKKTHGRWIDAQGNVQQTVSGDDEQSAIAWQLLQKAGLPPNRKPVVTTHVEAKVATQMIKSEQQHAELVLNNRPCVGPLGCDTLLPVLLPEGYSVTVYGPEGFTETFEGGEQW
ncbi:SCP1.201-like deaminase [Amycolatopsis oliviviridis]|uniref:SCP1.201-like deaminase n=1 Tax=Amycolatopsis oliviviridis TaxID=1471590 RepID=A0ABQ3MD79_9PSEU|nr:DddA-like double-stranded DNA deaminase toxin [Amycolatopsis oliviviridis]GHH32633.1 hypothetical protein GCM10017790_70040 [Amycolatopsis oliviviridis]